jgi:hypothetical protein
MIVGLFVVMFVMQSATHIAHHSAFERLVAGLVGLAFMFAGTLFAFGRSGIVIDRTDGVIRKWSGLSFWKFVTNTFPIENISRFAIEQQGPFTYVVLVQGGNTTIPLLTSHSYSVAREHADKIGAFLPIDCDDEVQTPPSDG